MRRQLLSMVAILVGALVLAACEPVFHEAPGECEFLNPLDQSASVALFPWVANGVSLDDQGAFHGTVSIQNVEDEDIEVDVLVGAGASGENWNTVETLDLSAHESITLDAGDLGIGEDSGASVVAIGYLNRGEYDDDADVCVEEPEYGRIAGTLKNVSPVRGGSAMTSSDHVTVDGYSAMRLDQVKTDVNDDAEEQHTFVLPIVQTNAGWDTAIRLANFEATGNNLTNVSVTFYSSRQQGYAGESVVENLQIRPGGVETVEVSEIVGDEWVGSAFITSSANIGAVAERHKSETDMLVTNLSRPETFERSTQYAPLVFKEYNYWNTGISVANTDPNQSNSVTITYYGPTMNQVGQDTLTIPPRGMEFVYTPGSQDLGLNEGFVGSAVIEGTTTLHAVVDQVKYFGDDPDVGQAMSYTTEPYAASVTDKLALPLAQKGNTNTGSGDTSGIQLFNVDPVFAIDVEITFYGANGVPVAPTVQNNTADPIQLTLGANQTYTLYAHELGELSSGFRGSAMIDVVGGEGAVVGVSNNVNYDVQGDGSAAFNLVGIPVSMNYSGSPQPTELP